MHACEQGCAIDGKPYATDKAQLEEWQEQNRVAVPNKHIGAPPEDGAFEFVPDQFRRKQ
jgi:hypothetical protein